MKCSPFDPFSSKELPNDITAYHFYFSDNFVVPLPSGLVAGGSNGGPSSRKNVQNQYENRYFKGFLSIVLKLLVSFFICYSVLAFPIVYSSYSV